ncbi:MAG: hypothetical protein JWO94_1345 [Verrucomicrobiaceae bacterium]|nr:hypothetical protein [Verrucomicrobiaceae bacterium]
MDITLRPVAILRTCYPQKFGVPRQSGLVPAAWGEVVFEPAYRRSEAVRGLEGFSHLWLITLFHEVPEEAVKLSVRPPRLGGNERVGVFASRSPFRPNRLALSVVKLERVEATEPRLYVSGVDLVDGTPVLDIKPYVPYADAVPGAVGGFAAHAPQPVVVTWQSSPPPAMPDHERRIIEQSLALQPQPAYQEETDREYAASIAGWEVRWVMRDGAVVVIKCAR